jgi:hypothetical protein
LEGVARRPIAETKANCGGGALIARTKAVNPPQFLLKGGTA